MNVNYLCPFSSPVEEKKKLKFCFLRNIIIIIRNYYYLAFECICKQHF